LAVLGEGCRASWTRVRDAFYFSPQASASGLWSDRTLPLAVMPTHTSELSRSSRNLQSPVSGSPLLLERRPTCWWRAVWPCWFLKPKP